MRMELLSKFENDKAGRPTTVVQPDGSEVAFTYDDRGNIICIKKATGGVENISMII